MECGTAPNMGSCGTPLVTRRGLECSPLLETYCHLSVRYMDINLTAVVEKLNILDSVKHSIEWWTISKAFEWSSKTNNVNLSSFKLLLMSSITL